MKKYHKIQSIFRREREHNKVIIGAYTLPEFEYLQNNVWRFDEKLDGINLRVQFDHDATVRAFQGRTDNAQLPVHIVEKLEETFPLKKLVDYFGCSACLYGEGIGRGIEKVGKYISKDTAFILFDVKIGKYWLRRMDVIEIANRLKIKHSDEIGKGTLAEAVEMTRNGFKSQWGDFIAEGLVLRPELPLQGRTCGRIITKIKYKDF